jgi:hypothetical protein
MKKIFLLMFLLFYSSIQLFAQRESFGHLTFISEENAPFYLYLNGMQYNKRAAAGVRIENVTQDFYNVKIVFQNPRLMPVIARGIRVADENGYMQDITYSVNSNRKGNRAFSIYNVIPMSPIYINENDFEIYNFGKTGYTIAPDKEFQNQWNNRKYRYRNHPNYNRRKWDNRDEQAVPTLSNADFLTALALIKDESFDANKLAAAQTISNAHYLSTNQILQILQLFSFESSKLQYAKSAYATCVDPQNYFKVNQVFSFSSSKQELNTFLNQMN